jgi:hypothetical protein
MITINVRTFDIELFLILYIKYSMFEKYSDINNV